MWRRLYKQLRTLAPSRSHKLNRLAAGKVSSSPSLYRTADVPFSRQFASDSGKIPSLFACPNFASDLHFVRLLMNHNAIWICFVTCSRKFCFEKESWRCNAYRNRTRARGAWSGDSSEFVLWVCLNGIFWFIMFVIESNAGFLLVWFD